MELPSKYSLPSRRDGFVAKRSPFGWAYALFHNGYFFGEVSLCDVGDLGVWVYVGYADDIAEVSGDMEPHEIFAAVRKAYEAKAADDAAEAAAEAEAERATEYAIYQQALDREEIEARHDWRY